MWRSLRRLRQPRYLALTALMLVIAALCAAAGTWQVARYRESVRINDRLTANAGLPAVPLAALHLPLAGSGASPDPMAIRFRRVSLTGSYLGTTFYVRKATVDDQNGFFVLSPVRTGDAVLLVVRGFVPSDGTTTPRPVAAPPSGTVQLTGRLGTASTKTDAAADLPAGQLESINPAEQAGRLGSPVYDAYLGLVADQPGTDGLTELPAPDLSNPAGGAYEWQHLAYVVQWYAFALLALAAPLLISRREVREAQREYLGVDPDELPDERDPVQPPDSAGAIALRDKPSSGELAHRTPAEQERIRRATALADRYGHRLEVPAGGRLGALRRRRPDADDRTAAGLPRSEDDYQGAYNDHLWQLAMADGNIPQLESPAPELPAPKADPVVIDHEDD